MPRIFVSYRREDSRHQAGRVHDRLVASYGHEQVFKDVDSIPLGWDFRDYLNEQVAACDIFLAIIGDRWLSVAGQNGSRRLADPGDWVRIEVEAALSRKIPVIPVLVGDAPVPSADVLPESLRELSFRNGIAVRPDPDFHKDMDRLIRGIELSLDALRKRQGVVVGAVEAPKPPVVVVAKPFEAPKPAVAVVATPVEAPKPAVVVVATPVEAPKPAVAVVATSVEAPKRARIYDTLITNSIGMKLKLIPAGEFFMGAAKGEPQAQEDEKPQHKVRITRPFYLGVYEVTQAEYTAVMGTNPSYFSPDGEGKARVAGMDTDRFPVENVSWRDAIAFCNKMSEREGLKPCYTAAGEPIATGTGYRLPTEAEWEYACRGQTEAKTPKTTPFSFGATITSDNANFDGSSTYNRSKLRLHRRTKGKYLKRTARIGSYRPNPFGLFDMHGNVYEWCHDGYDEGYYAKAPTADPHNLTQAADRVIRGGSWRNIPLICRSAYRGWFTPFIGSNFIGFRLARVRSAQ